METTLVQAERRKKATSGSLHKGNNETWRIMHYCDLSKNTANTDLDSLEYLMSALSLPLSRH